MAIYYIDPHTTTNGTGTWASPWSFGANTRTGLTANDEIRIKGIALTSLLTATSYTATVTNTYQLTITAGGGLGADWAAGNIGYLPDYDTFFRVYSVATNVIQVYTTTSMLPIYNWSVTSLTVRKVDTTTYPAGSATTAFYVGGSTAVNNITVSDGWTDATTRVTNGTVKTLIYSSVTGAATFLPTIGATSVPCTGWSVDMGQSAVVCYHGTTSGVIQTNIQASSSTITIGQIFGWGTSTATGLTVGTAATNPVNNTTITIKHLAGYYPIYSNNFYGPSNTLNITNLTTYSSDLLFGSVAAQTINSPNNTVSITNYFFNVASNSTLFYWVVAPELNISITGTIDQYGATTPTNLFMGYGSGTITIGSGVTYYYNKRASTKTSFGTLINGSATSTYYGNTYYAPTVTINNGWTFSARYAYPFAIPTLTSYLQTTYLPSSVSISLPTNSSPALPSGNPYGTRYPVNQTVTFRDGSAPFEILSICGNYDTATAANTSFPIVTTDATVYRTTGPSLKSYLGTRTAAYWVNKTSRAFKTIKVPATASVSKTITGYIRTDDSAYANGNCRISIYFNDVEVIGQDMTTSCVNAWEGFNLTFTPAITGEYILVMKMYYATAAKSYWMDDLTVS